MRALISSRGPCVDEICDVAELVQRFGRESFDLVVSTEEVEHVEDWRTAFEQMKLVLKPDGTLVLTTRSIGFPPHGHPYDFWRYQREDIETISGRLHRRPDHTRKSARRVRARPETSELATCRPFRAGVVLDHLAEANTQGGAVHGRCVQSGVARASTAAAVGLEPREASILPLVEQAGTARARLSACDSRAKHRVLGRSLAELATPRMAPGIAPTLGQLRPRARND